MIAAPLPALLPARAPRPAPLDDKLLWIDPRAGSYADRRVRDLRRILRPGDLLVVNDAATLPASFRGTLAGAAGPVELRLLQQEADGSFQAVLLGAGDWRTPTEERPVPETAAPGARLRIAADLEARVEGRSPLSPRLLRLRFDRSGDALWSALYRHGRPVQYAYLKAELPLWSVQTRYGARPWAMEMPSAGRPLTFDLLLRLAKAGVRIAGLTHACGLSSTGDPEIDAALPLPERFEIPEDTVDAIARAPGRVLAVGTSVVRALEGCVALHGTLRAGAGVTDLRIGPDFRPDFRPRVVTGLLSGLHETGTSHFNLLNAFAPPALLRAAYAHAAEQGYLQHEFGDSNLILPG